MERKKPLEHGIPEGRINKRYSSFPILQAISANRIRITPATAGHVANLFIKRLFTVGQDVSSFAPTLELGVVNAIRQAIPNGLVISSYPSEDLHNPLDRQLQIYIYVNIKQIDDDLEGTAKLMVLCRLSAYQGTLTIRNIQRNFDVEE